MKLHSYVVSVCILLRFLALVVVGEARWDWMAGLYGWRLQRSC